MEDILKHSYTVGPRGPVLSEDTVLHEALEEFVHTPRKQRVVHTKGFGAFGYFQVNHSMSEYTKAAFLQRPGKRIPVMTRFSLAVSTKGTPDTSRNVRGFSTKFYTDDGVFDLLCNHVPVFSVRDGIRFPDSIRCLSPSPVNNMADPKLFWEFYATAPEATSFLMYLYSDYGTIRSLRHIRASSVNTYVWRNAAGEKKYVKYHWLPVAGEEYITNDVAMKLAGENPDIAGKDLYDTIAAGHPVEYELCVQLMDPADEKELPYDPLDCTKVWSEDHYPLLEVGKLSLIKNPKDYNSEIEKVAFAPSNLAEGIEFSNDKMLQGRTKVYSDAQRYRLGPDFRKIPVNQQADFHPSMLVTSGYGDHVSGTQERVEIPKTDDFTQAGEYYRSLDEMWKEHLIDNVASQLYAMPKDLIDKALEYFQQTSLEFTERVIGRMNDYMQKEPPAKNNCRK